MRKGSENSTGPEPKVILQMDLLGRQVQLAVQSLGIAFFHRHGVADGVLADEVESKRLDE